MQMNINYDDNYSQSYLAQLSVALEESQKLGFIRPPMVAVSEQIPDAALRAARDVVLTFANFFGNILPGYWGNSCQTLSSNFFAQLNASGIPADIVLGNVIINGTDKFEVTLDSLRQEFHSSETLTGIQSVHAWVSIGGDTIIDAALGPRMARHYRAPDDFNELIMIDRASHLSSHYCVRYQPILLGTEFFAKTNPPDPMDLLNKIKQQRSA